MLKKHAPTETFLENNFKRNSPSIAFCLPKNPQSKVVEVSGVIAVKLDVPIRVEITLVEIGALSSRN